ncbi:hypothetical protein LSAT2_006830, partial [Lamellibrachia satsuma]
SNLLENADAYVIVYCTNDRMSFHRAVDILYRIRKEEGRDDAIILVANKTDLVRNREVAEQERSPNRVSLTDLIRNREVAEQGTANGPGPQYRGRRAGYG